LNLRYGLSESYIALRFSGSQRTRRERRCSWSWTYIGKKLGLKGQPKLNAENMADERY
jgi:hypothetical protein